MSTLVRAILFAGLIGNLDSVATAQAPVRAGPDWWSLRKIVQPETPSVKKKEWVRNPIDAFVLAQLEAKGLEPAVPADRNSWIRRVAFDLTGLPPTPKEIDDFVNDRSADAYEKLVDRLLASPAYGERWGRHWLDAVSFSESNGFEHDRLRENAWYYRDYVIKSFNDDKPYALFVQQQIAGDFLTPVTKEGIAATGFLVCGPWDQAVAISPSTSLRARAREDELEVILGTVGQTFLGLTINCARCHDHKYDPLLARDYYRLKAVFEGVYHGERSLTTPDDVRDWQKAVERRQARAREISRKIADIENRAREQATGESEKILPRPSARWSFDTDASDQVGRLHAILKGGARIVDGRLALDGKDAYVETPPLDRDLREKTLEAWVSLDNLEQRGGGVISVQTLDGSVFDAIVFGERKPGEWMAGSEFFRRTRDIDGPREDAKPGTPIHLAVVYSSDGRIALFRNGEKYGEPYMPAGDAGKPVGFAAGRAQIVIGNRHSGAGNGLLRGAVYEARLYDTALNSEEVRASYKAGIKQPLPRRLLDALSDDDRRELARLEQELSKVRTEKIETPAEVKTFAASIQTPGPTYVLKRGDYEMKAELVTAGAPASVKGPPGVEVAEDAAEGERRRQFAAWVVHRDNPLVWRVMANRIWQHHFGEGIVRTPNDFGFNGERPTHPQLLDLLAFTFREQGGSIKKLHRLIVLSAAYRQSAAFNAKAAEVDADNRLLWRFAPRRLEAEAVRDAMLSLSGRLNLQTGGPSFRPFKLELFNSNFYRLLDIDSPEFNRRSVYRMTVNSARDPVLETLDCPDPSVKTPRRAITTTPIQALALMNNSFIQRQAAVFAERIRKEAGESAAAQLDLAYRLAYGRTATKDERQHGMQVAKEHGMRAVCWAILNSSEFVYIR